MESWLQRPLRHRHPISTNPSYILFVLTPQGHHHHQGQAETVSHSYYQAKKLIKHYTWFLYLHHPLFKTHRSPKLSSTISFSDSLPPRTSSPHPKKNLVRRIYTTFLTHLMSLTHLQNPRVVKRHVPHI